MERAQNRAPAKNTAGSGNMFIYIFGALGGLNWGYDTGVVGAAMLFVEDEFGLSSFGVSAVVTFLIVGAIPGAMVGGKLSDAWGRRKVMFITAAMFLVAPIGMALAPDPITLTFFRFVAGLGAGLAAVVLPVYLSEIAPFRIRGAVTAFYGLAIVTGQFLGFGVGALFAPTADWRMMLGLSLVPSLAFAIGLLWVKESPRWLTRQGRLDDAREVLLRDRSPEETESELHEIMETDRISREAARSQWIEIRQAWVRPILVAGFGLAVLCQFMGINALMYYAPVTLVQVGFGAEAATVANVGVGSMNIIAVLLAVKVADKVGRRPLMLVGAAGCTLSLVVLSGTNLLMPSPDGIGPVGIITLVSMAVYIFMFQMSWGAVTWVILGELFPLGVRALAMGAATTVLWIANGVVAAVFPPLLEAIGVGWLFAMFAVFCLTAFLFAYRYLPETKDRLLEDIEREYREKAAASNG